MRYQLIGCALGLGAGLYAISLGDPQFFTAEHVETVAHHLGADRLLSGHQLQPEAFAGGANGVGGEGPHESCAIRDHGFVECVSHR